VLGREGLDPGTRDVRRREDRHGEALAGELVAPLLRLGLERIVGEVELDGVLEDDGGPFAEVIEERRCGTQSRRERVYAGRVPTLAERIDEPPVRREVGTVLAVGTRESIPAGAVEALREPRGGLERELARGQDDELFEGRLRSLRHRVERTQRLDLVAEELDARGLLSRSGVDVDDAAAPRERARLVHFRHRLVPKIEEPRRGLRPRQLFARAKRAPAPRELRRRDRVFEQRAQAGDDSDRGLCRREPPEREEPLMHRRAGRGARLERHRLALGEREDAIFAEPSGELRAPAAGPILARRHERDDSCVLRDER